MGIPNTPPHAPNPTSLADALFPKVRQRVLAVLFGRPERSFYMGEVIALAQSGTGAVQRELVDLAAAGILSVHRQGKQKHYQANAQSPAFEPLQQLVGKSMGVANVLGTALQPVARHISAAFFHENTSVAKGEKASTIALTLFGKSLADGVVAGAVAQALQAASNTLARQLKISSYTPASLADAVALNAKLPHSLRLPSNTWLKGDADNLFGKVR